MTNHKKIYDCFLYFQEFEILEIRIKYLYDFVDYFIIIEFNQSFSGETKEFNLEKKIKRLERFQDKIFYFKIDEHHKSFDDLISFLDKKDDKISKIIKKNMLSHTHYDLNEVNWVIETYQRESIYYALNNFEIYDEDLIIISDIDEIPNYQILNDLKEKAPYDIISFKQNVFSYFVNLLSANDWYGSIIAKWKKLDFRSLNLLRLDVKNKFNIVKSITYQNGGYHFTSIGSIEDIENKIKNWSHQEFNNILVLSSLKKNIFSGRDIFGRSFGQKYRLININNEDFFDKRISKLIKGDYDNLLIHKLANINILSEIYFFIGVKFLKILYFIKIKIGLKKKK